MVDYHINLAKELVSTPKERERFYNGMLIYLSVCSVALVFFAYFSSFNIQNYMKNQRMRQHLLATSSTEMDAFMFSNPDQVYTELRGYADQVGILKQALEQRVQLLPTISNLFLDLPDQISLQSLSADKNKMSFGLLMPSSSDETGDPVRMLKNSWTGNSALMKSVSNIRPITGERRVVGSNSLFFVQFECVLN